MMKILKSGLSWRWKNERYFQDGNGSAGGDHMYFDFAVVSEVGENERKTYFCG